MKPTGFLTLSAAAFVMGSLNACAVGPDYQPPPAPQAGALGVSVPAPASAAGSTQSFDPGADISGQWWTLFHNPALNQLIATALANNPSLTAAQATLIEAEETVRAAQGSFLPQLSASFLSEREKISSAELANSGNTATAGAPISIPPFDLYNASLSVSYSPDIFGGTRRQVESLIAQSDYERFELEAAYLTLTANIVTAAVTEASLTAQIAATQQIIGFETKQLGILNAQYALGGAPRANVLNEQATLAGTRATLPPLQSSLAQVRNQLADYTGALPANFHEADFTLDSLQLPADLPVSLPSAIVAQRPDIAAAAAQLHTATANVGVATANMLPQISLSADVGHDALTTASLFTPATLAWSLIGQITQPLFEGGTLDARRQASVAALNAAAAQYQTTVLSAFQNVADALQTLQFDAATLDAAQIAATASAQSLAVTQDQYKLGGEPFTAVLSAQTTYQNAVITRVKAQAARLTDTAALFVALGGGWWHREDVTQTCCGIVP